MATEHAATRLDEEFEFVQQKQLKHNSVSFDVWTIPSEPGSIMDGRGRSGIAAGFGGRLVDVGTIG